MIQGEVLKHERENIRVLNISISFLAFTLTDTICVIAKTDIKNICFILQLFRLVDRQFDSMLSYL